MTLAVDRAEIARFVQALFCDLDPLGYVSLRAFRQFPVKGERDRPLQIQAVRLNLGLEPVIGAAERIATRVSNGGEAAVFASAPSSGARVPRPATCTSPGPVGRDRPGQLEQIADGLTLILGPRPTIVLHSGSLWVDPAAGELLPKGHLHWRLSRPVRGPEPLRMLRRARDIATLIAGGEAYHVCRSGRAQGYDCDRAGRSGQTG